MKSTLPILFTGLFLLVVIFNKSFGQERPIKKNWRDNLSFSMVAETDFSYEYKNNRLQKAEFILNPEWQYKFNKNIKLVGIGRWYMDATDNLEPGKPIQKSATSVLDRRSFGGDRMELELREFYLHSRIKKIKMHLRVGKQQIVWGETDGLKLLDVVNPQYFREFVLDEFEDSRIPLWSVKADFSIGNWKAQLVWVPDQTYHVLPDFSAPFFPGSLVPNPPPGVEIKFNQAKRPSNWITDSDIGLKLSAFLGGWDLTFNYFFHYEDLPVLYQQLEFPNGEGPAVVKVNPNYERQHLAGMTFNKPVGNLTLRGELAYTFDRHFSTTDKTYEDGITQSDNLQVALGLDYITGEWFFSPQVFNNYLIRKVQAYNRDRHEINTSLLVSREFLSDSFKSEILWVQNLNKGDGMLRPKLTYWLKSNLELFLSSDIFYGNEEGLFGQFQERSRISTGLVLGI